MKKVFLPSSQAKFCSNCVPFHSYFHCASDNSLAFRYLQTLKTPKAPKGTKVVLSQTKRHSSHGLSSDVQCFSLQPPHGFPRTSSSTSVSVLYVGISGWGQHSGASHRSWIVGHGPSVDELAAPLFVQPKMQWLLCCSGALMPHGQPGVPQGPKIF